MTFALDVKLVRNQSEIFRLHTLSFTLIDNPGGNISISLVWLIGHMEGGIFPHFPVHNLADMGVICFPRNDFMCPPISNGEKMGLTVEAVYEDQSKK